MKWKGLVKSFARIPFEEKLEIQSGKLIEIETGNRYASVRSIAITIDSESAGYCSNSSLENLRKWEKRLGFRDICERRDTHAGWTLTASEVVGESNRPLNWTLLMTGEVLQYLWTETGQRAKPSNIPSSLRKADG
ncbi:hypothetical protein K438DRAFT_1759517 [Mycena galopus ATCC 62051]|nr:hypothetical protein K438DRAFT_1759517 [Mycena galopus ATCC 62051]